MKKSLIPFYSNIGIGIEHLCRQFCEVTRFEFLILSCTKREGRNVRKLIGFVVNQVFNRDRIGAPGPRCRAPFRATAGGRSRIRDRRQQPPSALIHRLLNHHPHKLPSLPVGVPACKLPAHCIPASSLTISR